MKLSKIGFPELWRAFKLDEFERLLEGAKTGSDCYDLA